MGVLFRDAAKPLVGAQSRLARKAAGLGQIFVQGARGPGGCLGGRVVAPEAHQLLAVALLGFFLRSFLVFRLCGVGLGAGPGLAQRLGRGRFGQDLDLRAADVDLEAQILILGPDRDGVAIGFGGADPALGLGLGLGLGLSLGLGLGLGLGLDLKLGLELDIELGLQPKLRSRARRGRQGVGRPGLPNGFPIKARGRILAALDDRDKNIVLRRLRRDRNDGIPGLDSGRGAGLRRRRACGRRTLVGFLDLDLVLEVDGVAQIDALLALLLLIVTETDRGFRLVLGSGLKLGRRLRFGLGLGQVRGDLAEARVLAQVDLDVAKHVVFVRSVQTVDGPNLGGALGRRSGVGSSLGDVFRSGHIARGHQNLVFELALKLGLARQSRVGRRGSGVRLPGSLGFGRRLRVGARRLRQQLIDFLVALDEHHVQIVVQGVNLGVGVVKQGIQLGELALAPPALLTPLSLLLTLLTLLTLPVLLAPQALLIRPGRFGRSLGSGRGARAARSRLVDGNQDVVEQSHADALPLLAFGLVFAGNREQGEIQAAENVVVALFGQLMLRLFLGFFLGARGLALPARSQPFPRGVELFLVLLADVELLQRKLLPTLVAGGFGWRFAPRGGVRLRGGLGLGLVEQARLGGNGPKPGVVFGVDEQGGDVDGAGPRDPAPAVFALAFALALALRVRGEQILDLFFGPNRRRPGRRLGRVGNRAARPAHAARWGRNMGVRAVAGVGKRAEVQLQNVAFLRIGRFGRQGVIRSARRFGRRARRALGFARGSGAGVALALRFFVLKGCLGGAGLGLSLGLGLGPGLGFSPRPGFGLRLRFGLPLRLGLILGLGRSRRLGGLGRAEARDGLLARDDGELGQRLFDLEGGGQLAGEIFGAQEIDHADKKIERGVLQLLVRRLDDLHPACAGERQIRLGRLGVGLGPDVEQQPRAFAAKIGAQLAHGGGVHEHLAQALGAQQLPREAPGGGHGFHGGGGEVLAGEVALALLFFFAGL